MSCRNDAMAAVHETMSALHDVARKRPSGVSLKLLSLLEKNGLACCSVKAKHSASLCRCYSFPRILINCTCDEGDSIWSSLPHVGRSGDVLGNVGIRRLGFRRLF